MFAMDREFNKLIEKYKDQAEEYKKEYYDLEDAVANGEELDFEGDRRYAEVEALYNKCIEVYMDLESFLKRGELEQ